MEGVATEKLKLFEAIKADGTIAINMDDPILSVAAKRYCARKITFRPGRGTDVRIKVRGAGPRGWGRLRGMGKESYCRV